MKRTDPNIVDIAVYEAQEGDAGQYVGVVLHKQPSLWYEDGFEYVTHQFVWNGPGHHMELFWGHYYGIRERAVEDYEQRLASYRTYTRHE